MENEGWIKLHRKFTNWEWYTDTNTKVVFLHLLFLANIDEKRYKGFSVKRGECIIGRKKLSEDLNLSEQSVRTALNHLISSNEITIKPTNKFSIVTICKYDNYQDLFFKTNQQNNQQLINKTTNKTTNNQPTLKSDIEMSSGNCIFETNQQNNQQLTNKTTNKTTNKLTNNQPTLKSDIEISSGNCIFETNQQNNQQLTNKLTTPKEYNNIYKYKEEIIKEEKTVADKSATQKTLEERQKDFYNELIPFVDKYGNDMIRSFYNYWSQVNKGGKKMLWEMQKAFEISKRLATWRGKNFAPQQSSNDGLYRNKTNDEWEQAKNNNWI